MLSKPERLGRAGARIILRRLEGSKTMLEFRKNSSLGNVINQGIDRALLYEQQQFGDLLSSIFLLM